MAATPPKEPAEHQGEEKTIGVNDEAKVHGDLKNGEAKKVKKEDDDDKEEDKKTDDVTKSFQHLEVTSGRTTKAAQLTTEQQKQTEKDLTFEQALERARKSELLPPWQGAPGGQQAFIDKLTKPGKGEDATADKNAKPTCTLAKAEFNRLCKEKQEKIRANVAIGNSKRDQAIHPPDVAIDVAVTVYNKFFLKE